MMFLKVVGKFATSIYPDQIISSLNLDLYCLLKCCVAIFIRFTVLLKKVDKVNVLLDKGPDIMLNCQNHAQLS